MREVVCVVGERASRCRNSSKIVVAAVCSLSIPISFLGFFQRHQDRISTDFFFRLAKFKKFRAQEKKMKRLFSLAFLKTLQGHPLLGRWCHPNSHAVCDQVRKADLANADNSYSSFTPLKLSVKHRRRFDRDPVSVFVCD